jgi:hypothetical protein
MMRGVERSVVGVPTRLRACSLQGPKRSIPPNVGQAQFLATLSLQNTLVGLAFALVVVGVAPV